MKTARDSDSRGVLAESPDRAYSEDRQPRDDVDDPGPVHTAAEQWRVHQLVKPVLRRPFGDVLYRLREQADRDEQAAHESEQRHDQAEELRDGIGGDQETDEEPERGEKQRADPDAPGAKQPQG